MKFLNQLNEALRRIPKDLPDKSEWGSSSVEMYCDYCGVNVEVQLFGYDHFDPYCPICNNQGLGPPKDPDSFRNAVPPRLNEALRKIPKNLPGEDEWSGGPRHHNVLVAGMFGTSMDDVSTITEIVEDIFSQYHGFVSLQYDGRVMPDGYETVWSAYPDLVNWSREHHEEGKNVFTFKLLELGGDAGEHGFERDGLDIWVMN